MLKIFHLKPDYDRIGEKPESECLANLGPLIILNDFPMRSPGNISVMLNQLVGRRIIIAEVLYVVVLEPLFESCQIIRRQYTNVLLDIVK